MKKKGKSSHLVIVAAAILLLAAVLMIRNGASSSSGNSPDQPRQGDRSAGPKKSRSKDEVSSYLRSARDASTQEDRLLVLHEFLDPEIYPMTPLDGLQELFGNWFGADSESALQAIGEIKDERTRALCLVEGTELFRKDPTQVIKVLEGYLTDPGAKFDFVRGCYKEMAAIDPASMLQLLKKSELKEYRKESIGVLFESFSSQNVVGFPDVFALAAGLSDKQDRLLAFKSALKYCAHNMRVEDIEKLSRETKDSNLVKQAFRGYSKNKIDSTGVASYLESLRKMDLSNGCGQEAVSLCLRNMQGAGGMDKALQDLGASPLRDAKHFESDVVAVLVSDWPIENAIKFSRTIDDRNPDKPELFGRIADRMVREDTKAAAEWISSLPPGKSRDKALRPMLRYLERTGETASLKEWKSLLSNN